MTDLATRWRRLWRGIHEPRVVKVIYAIGYAIATATGVLTLLRPPSSIEIPLGSQLTLTWALLLLCGATAALVAVFPGWWWLERIGIWALAAGALIYLVVVLILHFQGPPESSRLTQAGIILGFAWGFSVRRLWEIRGYTFEPRRR